MKTINLQPIHRNSTMMKKIIKSLERHGSFDFEGMKLKPIDTRREGVHIHLKCEILFSGWGE